MRLWLTIYLIAFGLAAQAATNTAASVSLANVTTAYNACADGDTLLIPAGSATWSSGLTVSKGISIIGAGSNLTTIARAGQVFYVSGITGKPLRIAHMMLNIGGYYGGGNYPIQIVTSESNTNSPFSVRIDHIWMEKGQYAITLTGINVWGVIDHCTFHNCDNGVQLNGGSYVWQYPITPGTTNCMVIEADRFICDALSQDMNESIMSGHGVRFVVRYNLFDGTGYTTGNDYLPYENHGKGGTISTSPPSSDELRGPPIFEIYMNTMAVHSTYRHMNIRGGSCLVWSNVLTAVSSGTPVINVTEDNYDPSGWSGIDQIENSYFWGNTGNGSALSPTISVQTATNQIIQDRDYFLHAPNSSSGKITWSDWAGSHNATFNAGVAQAYYPYTPLVYPHPIVTAQDGGSTATNPPSITAQPVSQTVQTNTAATFIVTATGDGTLAYQWSLAGTNVTGATASTWNYTPTVAQTNNVYVGITNAYGGLVSSTVTLSATNAATGGGGTTNAAVTGTIGGQAVIGGGGRFN